ncbi:hypothetical protein RUM44_010871 [Polyplax serrata]|uniref:Mif2/CENP-C cupin domain-containing protein n=1 Tax=Polyplax serrata TaxID=468196 RepID=A0ABR1AQ48_POLSC
MTQRVHDNAHWQPFATSTPVKCTGKMSLNKSSNPNVVSGGELLTALLKNFQKTKQLDSSKSRKQINKRKSRIGNKVVTYFSSRDSSSSEGEDENDFSLRGRTLTLKFDSMSTRKIRELDKGDLLQKSLVNTDSNDISNNLEDKLGKIECKISKTAIGISNSSTGKNYDSKKALSREPKAKKKDTDFSENSESSKFHSEKKIDDVKVVEKPKYKQHTVDKYLIRDKNNLNKEFNGNKKRSHIAINRKNRKQSFNKNQNKSHSPVDQSCSIASPSKEDVNNLSIFNSPFEKLNARKKVLTEAKSIKSGNKVLRGKIKKLKKVKNSKIRNIANLSHQLFSESKEQELLNSLDLTGENSTTQNSFESKEKGKSTTQHENVNSVSQSEAEVKDVKMNENFVTNLENHSEEKKQDSSKENIKTTKQKPSRKRQSSTKLPTEDNAISEKLIRQSVLTEDKRNIVKHKKPYAVTLTKPGIGKIPIRKCNIINKKSKVTNTSRKNGNLKPSSETLNKQGVEQIVPTELGHKRKGSVKNMQEEIVEKQNKVSNDSSSNQVEQEIVELPDSGNECGRKPEEFLNTNDGIHSSTENIENGGAAPEDNHEEQRGTTKKTLNENDSAPETGPQEKTTEKNKAVAAVAASEVVCSRLPPCPDVLKRLNFDLTFREYGPGCSIAECWSLKNFKCGVLQIEPNSETSEGRTVHDNSYFGGTVIEGDLMMRIGHEVKNLKKGDMTFIPPLTNWSAKNIADGQALMYFWCGRFKA